MISEAISLRAERNRASPAGRSHGQQAPSLGNRARHSCCSDASRAARTRVAPRGVPRCFPEPLRRRLGRRVTSPGHRGDEDFHPVIRSWHAVQFSSHERFLRTRFTELSGRRLSRSLRSPQGDAVPLLQVPQRFPSSSSTEPLGSAPELLGAPSASPQATGVGHPLRRHLGYIWLPSRSPKTSHRG